jgi:hypothetical protein
MRCISSTTAVTGYTTIPQIPGPCFESWNVLCEGEGEIKAGDALRDMSFPLYPFEEEDFCIKQNWQPDSSYPNYYFCT